MPTKSCSSIFTYKAHNLCSTTSHAVSNTVRERLVRLSDVHLLRIHYCCIWYMLVTICKEHILLWLSSQPKSDTGAAGAFPCMCTPSIPQQNNHPGFREVVDHSRTTQQCCCEASVAWEAMTEIKSCLHGKQDLLNSCYSAVAQIPD